MILSLVLWYVAAAGLAVVVGHSAVTLPLRRWLAPIMREPLSGNIELKRSDDITLTTAPPFIIGVMPRGAFPGSRLLCELLECPMCLGVWEGGIAAAIGLVHTPYPFAISVAVLALSTSAVNFAYGRLTGVI